MEKIKLYDGTEFEIAGVTTSGITFDTTITELATIKESITKSNLKSFSILDSAGDVESTMENYKPTGNTSLTDTDDGVTAVIGISKMTEEDIRLTALEETADTLVLAQLDE